MANRIRVAVWGNALHMAGIAAGLRADPRLEVISLNPGSSAAWQSLDDFAPAVIAFELDGLPPDLTFRLLRSRPGLQLIGIDPSSRVLLTLSARQECAQTMADVVRVILGTSLARDQLSQ